MKVLSTLFLLVALSVTSIAQAPNAFNYQGVARNINNVPLSEQQIGLQITILQDSISGIEVYKETHRVMTSELGLFSIQIGTGSVVEGTFQSINWQVGNFFIQIGMDENGGSNYQTIGASQFLSVPYAQFANNGSKWTEVEPEFRINYPQKVNIGNTNPIFFDHDLNIVRNTSGTIGLSVMNENPSGRSILLAGEQNLQRYIYLAYNNSNWNPQFSAFKPESGIIFSGGENGMNNICPNGDITFVTGGLEASFTRLVINQIGNIGIGTGSPNSKLQVTDGDIYIEDINKGVIMKSPNGQCWRYTPNNSGQLTPTPITCPN